MTLDLITFLTARLDEDEALIHRNSDGHGLSNGFPDYRTYVDADTKAADEYIEHFGPARAVRSIEADRRIIEAHNRAEHYCPIPVLPGRHSQLWMLEEGPCWTLRLLAAVYSDHPDYRQEWKP